MAMARALGDLSTQQAEEIADCVGRGLARGVDPHRDESAHVLVREAPASHFGFGDARDQIASQVYAAPNRQVRYVVIVANALSLGKRKNRKYTRC